jgi:type VI secretion system secreted protein VgrG
MRLVSGKGPLEIESHGDQLKLIAQQDMTLQTVQGHLQVTAKNGITLGCGGGFIRIKPDGGIDIHSPGLINYKGEHRFDVPAGEQFALPELPSSVCEDCLQKAQARAAAGVLAEPRGRG